ncbi:FAD-dependent oxidoreductase [Panacibacter ginsenosidivorans]|uniref:FAD-dependent oxidoreductase n=1 Tax=Panacibacter ginsenosidivorans TaxID=1813871 RepID=A0A5B8VA09_9BACT|nr:FAD-dependent oxidoreductase [Panacibacter ginsenosidivorans]QEC68099.1 FAD-dependent oxidoreductase [Panacibacter ginsenosidivorans]
MLEPWRTGIVIKLEDVTPSTRRFWIQIPELEKFDFKPGQFVTLDLPIHEKKNKRWRSYSIASAPDGTNVFELIIVLLEEGTGTTYLFKEIKEGSEILLRGPQGVFTLPETINEDLFLICTGTGIAPFRSMAHYIHKHNIPHKNLYLIFGCRKECDALYRDELEELEKQMPSFHYLPTFSREEPEANKRTGYVHNVYEEILSTGNIEAKFFLCGWKNMIDEAKQRITGLGYDRKDIHLELYG